MKKLFVSILLLFSLFNLSALTFKDLEYINNAEHIIIESKEGDYQLFDRKHLMRIDYKKSENELILHLISMGKVLYYPIHITNPKLVSHTSSILIVGDSIK